MSRIEVDGALIDPMTPPYSARCRCPSCNLYFTAASAFDAHRTGPYPASIAAPTLRRCLTEAEMRVVGMEQSASGHWQRTPRGRSSEPPPLTPEPRSDTPPPFPTGPEFAAVA